jgi:hypothetical protein
MKPSRILIFMFVVSTVFHLALAAMNDPTANNVQVIGQHDVEGVTINDPNPVFGFLGPLMIVWNYIIGLLKFLDAPYQFLNAIGAPPEVKLLIGVPWRLSWIWGIVSFIRGYEG